MSDGSDENVTRLLLAWNDGDANASAQLLPLIYEHLRAMARGFMQRERDGHTLQPTALVHEAFLRMSGGAPVRWQDRAHFYSLAARAMRAILVDHARTRQAVKRGGVQQRVPLSAAEDHLAAAIADTGPDLVVLDRALARLAEARPRPGHVVELKFFGGMESRDIAEVLKVSEKTILRDWQFAKLWLFQEMGHGVE